MGWMPGSTSKLCNVMIPLNKIKICFLIWRRALARKYTIVLTTKVKIKNVSIDKKGSKT